MERQFEHDKINFTAENEKSLYKQKNGNVFAIENGKKVPYEFHQLNGVIITNLKQSIITNLINQSTFQTYF